VDEYTSPAVIESPTGNLTDMVVDNAAQAPDKVVFSRRSGVRWLDVTCRDFLIEVSALAKGLMAAGVGAGDRVALMSRTRYEWSLIDYAIWFAGAVTVPIYETSSAEQVQWILSDSAAKFVFVESTGHGATLAEVRDDLPTLSQVWTIDDGDLDTVADAGTAVTDQELEVRRTSAATDSLATIIYTSGTTGRPKGCELSHLNFLSEVGNIVHASGEEKGLSALFQDPDAATLLFLPLAHVFARAIEVGCVMARGRVGHTADVKNLIADLEQFRPTFILSVPRVFEKVYNSAEQKAEAAGKGKIFHAAADTAIAYSEALDDGGPGLGLKAKHAIFDKLVYAKLRAALGGRPAGRSRAERRSATGSATSSAASASRSSRATDSRRRQPPSREPSGPQPDRHGRAAPAGRHDPHRRGRRGRRQGRPRLQALPQQRRGHGRGVRRRLVPHRRHRRAGRRRLSADHRSQEGAHRHRGRQERRARSARGPASRAPPGEPVHGRRRRPALHRLPRHTGRRSASLPG
jgi:hypothetical protein